MSDTSHKFKVIFIIEDKSIPQEELEWNGEAAHHLEAVQSAWNELDIPVIQNLQINTVLLEF